MKLDEYDDSIQVQDDRGGGGGLPLGAGGVGCGGLVIALIAALVFGVDPAQMLGQMSGSGPVAQQSAPQGGASLQQSCTVNTYSHEACNALASLNHTWQPLFQKANIAFKAPRLVFYSQADRSGCGAAQSAMGPFYCPNDQGIYIDTTFYDEMQRKLGATGEFARLYVVAHEYGHHVQNLLGLSDQVQSAQQANPGQANALSVRLELQADCYAGVWAAKNKDRIQPGDLESGLNAAHQIGDDTLMREAGRRPTPENFTHGSSAQRMEWLRKGMETGDEDQCDTFADLKR